MQILPDGLVFDTYAYYRFCSDFIRDDNVKIKPSLKMLSILSKTDEDQIVDLPRQDAVALMLPKIPQKYRSKVARIENVLNERYQINRDCEDNEAINQVIENFYEVLTFIPKNNMRNLKIRQEIYSNLYDLDEQNNPSCQRNRFAILTQMINEIPNVNDGAFDYNPLNIAARQTEYFMKNIPARERLTLLNKINTKTLNHERYNYARQISELDKACFIAKQEEKLELKENAQARYEQIRNSDLPEAESTAEKIELYNELLGLINSQDWGRGRKFSEKKTICNHLINLYQSAGMIPEMERAKEDRDRYLNARNICREAARLKGYKSGKER